jgi:ornithine cyclodeaminase/alanine dehydrogenase-like protein (mu-crystallin family)
VVNATSALQRRGTLLLTRSDVERLLDLPACIAAVEAAFRLLAQGQAPAPAVAGVHATDGGFHIKAALMGAQPPNEREYFAAKVNANFPHNPGRRGLPTIQGVLALFDASCGVPLAVMDSIALTILRTAAASAVAARYLARADAATITIVGCGAQALVQLAALCAVRPLERGFAIDTDAELADRFARSASEKLGIAVSAVSDLERTARSSDIIVTCTTSRRAFLGARHLAPGAFVAAVGADNGDKQEIEPALLASSAVVTDSTDQCASIGDLHHALTAGLMTRTDVRAELGDVILDPRRGRRDESEITVFDSTGVAVQDVAAASLVYSRALHERIGLTLDFGSTGSRPAFLP